MHAYKLNTGKFLWLGHVSWPQTDRCSVISVDVKRIELNGRTEDLGCRGLGNTCGEPESELGSSGGQGVDG